MKHAWNNCAKCNGGSFIICRVCGGCEDCCPSLPKAHCEPAAKPSATHHSNKSVTRAAISAVRKAGEEVLAELRTLALYELPSVPTLPPPYDLEAEEAVMEALVAGRSTPDELGVTATDFYYPAYTAVVSVIEALDDKGMLDGAPNPETIAAVLTVQGVDQARMLELLNGLLEDVPMRVNVSELAERIVMLNERRTTLALMTRLDCLWRNHQPAPGELVRDLTVALLDECRILGIPIHQPQETRDAEAVRD